MQTLNKTLENYTVATRSAHYKRRADGQYDVVARVKIDGDWRYAAISVQPNRVKAVETVRFVRSGGTA